MDADELVAMYAAQAKASMEKRPRSASKRPLTARKRNASATCRCWTRSVHLIWFRPCCLGSDLFGLRSTATVAASKPRNTTSLRKASTLCWT